MPSKNMLPKGKRRHSVRAEYRAQRTAEVEAAEAARAAMWAAGVDAAEAEPPAEEAVEDEESPRRTEPKRTSVRREVTVPALGMDPYAAGAASLQQRAVVPAEAAGLRLDLYLARALPEISRSRVQLLLDNGQVRVNGRVVPGKYRMEGGEDLLIEGSPTPPAMEARAEALPLDVVYEDQWLAVVNKPAGMTVHAGAAKPHAGEDGEDDEAVGADPRTSGTLVNALLHHFAGKLSGVGGELRPGIVHRLDKETSGLLLVAKDDRTHRKLGEAFAERRVEKRYQALVHGQLRLRAGQDEMRVDLPIGRDLVRRTRMTTRRPADAPGVRHAVSHVRVLERVTGAWGEFTLVEVRIETGRTHQIRVHLQALGHPVVGDTTYGAPESLVRQSAPAVGRRASVPAQKVAEDAERLRLPRNFLHAGSLKLAHPQTGDQLELAAPMPKELVSFLRKLRDQPAR